MERKIMKKTIAFIALLTIGANAHALVWDWSFAGETGQFITDGADHSGGTYNVTDFIVTSSTAGATLGSWSGGQYDDTVYTNGSPYSFDWDGSSVTNLHSSQGNWDNWFTFNDLSSSFFYVFGWETGNKNTISHASIYDFNAGCCSQNSYVYNIAAAQVSEPTTFALLALGIAGLIVTRKVKNA